MLTINRVHPVLKNQQWKRSFASRTIRIGDANLKAWARLRVAQLHDSRVGIRCHRADLLCQGESPTKIEKLTHWQGCWQFTDLERLVLALAEALTLKPDSVSCRILLHYTRKMLSGPAFIELVTAIESVNEWNFKGSG